MRIAIFQGPEEAGEVARNLRRLQDAAAAAAAERARLLICPEMFLTGYNIGAAAQHLAQPADGPALRQAAEIAKAAGVALLFGYPERGPGGAVYNAAALVGRDGRTLASARKCHLFGDLDRALFTPGEGPFASAVLDGLKLGILICYDVEFPEAVRALALAGCGLVAVPTALMEPFDVVARTIVPARAYENQSYLAYANRCGREGDLVYCGQSCIVAPDGTDLARAGQGEELIVADLDPARLETSRAINTHLRDRRPELYQALIVQRDSARET